MLRPLVVEEKAGWRLFHNDVRIFLRRLLHSEATLYADSASRMADYLRSSADELTQHEALQDLFGIAERYVDQAKLFTPAYVIAGHAVGYPVPSLISQGLVAADALTKCESDWALVQGVACGLRTVVQLTSALEWRADATEQLSQADATTVRRARSVELGVTPMAAWSQEVVLAALTEIQELASVHEFDRAQAAFRRWFGGVTPARIVKAALANPASHELQDNSDRLSIGQLLGQASAATRIYLPSSRGRSKLTGLAEAGYARGLLKAASAVTRPSRFMSVLRRLQRFYFDDVQGLIESLLEARHWTRLALLLRVLPQGKLRGWPNRIFAAVASALLRRPRFKKQWVDPLMREKEAAIAGAVATSRTGGTVGNQLSTMSALAFLLGMEEAARDPSAR